MEEHDPLGGGETVYATDPGEERPEERDWPDHTDPEWLHYQYHILKNSTTEMVNIAGVAHSTIRYHMDKNGMERRDMSEALKLRRRPKKLRNEEWLRERYVEDGMGTAKISELVDCSPETVTAALRDHNIPARDAKKPRSEIYDSPGELFYRRHVRGETNGEIANAFGVSVATVHNAMRVNEIESAGGCLVNILRWNDEKSITVSEREEKPFVKDSSLDYSYRDFSTREVREGWVPYRDKEWLEQQYVDDELPTTEIVQICSGMGCEATPQTIFNWLRKHDIDIRSNAEVSQLQSNLSEDDVANIRKRYANGVLQRELAKEYGLGPSGISSIVRGDTWGDAPGPIKGEDYD